MAEDIETSYYRHQVCNKYCSLGDTGTNTCKRDELSISCCISHDMAEKYYNGIE